MVYLCVNLIAVITFLLLLLVFYVVFRMKGLSQRLFYLHIYFNII